MQRHIVLALAATAFVACRDATRPTEPIAQLNASKVGAAPREYQVTLLETRAGFCSGAVDLNDHDQVIGWIFPGPSCPPVSGVRHAHAFFWENGVMQDLGTLGGSESNATDINEHGQVVGWAETADGSSHAFFWDKGILQDLGPVVGVGWAPIQDKVIRGIYLNKRGQVVGHRPEGGVFLWDRGTTQMLPLDHVSAINDAGQVVGWVFRDVAGVRVRRAASWDAGTLTELGTLRSDGGGGSLAAAIGKHGTVIGTMSTDPRGQEPNITFRASFRWRDGQLQDLGAPAAGNQPEFEALLGDEDRVVAVDDGQGVAAVWDNGAWALFVAPRGFGTWPTDMNSSGAIVGSDGSRGAGQAFVWQNGVGQLFGDYPCSRAQAINDKGVVVGWIGHCFAPHSQTPVMWVPVKSGGTTVAAVSSSGVR
jgi:probable HAF family extracellular repeat protein